MKKMGYAAETFKDTAKAAVNGEELHTTAEEEQKRLDLCNSCPMKKNITEALPMCSECGCAIKLVAKVATKKCPLGKF